MRNKRYCPLCGSKNNTILYVQKFSNSIFYNIVSCNICKFVFVNNVSDQSYFDTYYTDSDKYVLDRGEEFHDKYYHIISKYVKKSSKILDIGCSNGQFLYKLKKRGYHNIAGIEPSPECKQIAHDKYGIHIDTFSIFNFVSTQKYDLVILSAVLEHLEDAKKAVEIIRNLLKDKGHVFVSVPNAGRFYVNFDEPFGEFSIEHINFFTQSSLYQLMDGFSCTHMTFDNKAIYSLWKKDLSSRDAMNTYIKISREKLSEIQKVITTLPNKVIVWGAGSLTQRILQSTNLAKKILFVVDRDENLQGKKLNSIKIVSPEKLHEYKETILISSFRFRDEIKKDITSMKLKNKVITF